MAVIDNAAYGELLAEALPRVIRSDRENERLIAEMERIDLLPRPTPAQKALSELIALLVEEYERRYDLGHAEPLEALKRLMERSRHTAARSDPNVWIVERCKRCAEWQTRDE
jgi:hypothetical protein